jgi:predicted Zn-dependent protease
MTSKSDRLAQAVQLRESGELDKARLALIELRGEFPDDAAIAVQAAWVHDTMGLEEEAAKHYAVAIAGALPEADLRGAYLGFASTLRTLGRDAESEEVFRKGIERFPTFRPLRVFHAMLAYNTGRPREAVQALVGVLLESTGDADILRYRRALTGYAADLDRSWL